MNRNSVLAGALLTLGLLQMCGDLLDRAGVHGAGAAMRALGAAGGASPAPRVFSAVRGLETFSTRFYIEWISRDGAPYSIEVTPALYSRMQGPYPRRNAYGAALAYGPVMAATPQLRELHASVMRFALCGDAPLLRELGIDGPRGGGTILIRYVPASGSTGELPNVISAECQ